MVKKEKKKTLIKKTLTAADLIKEMEAKGRTKFYRSRQPILNRFFKTGKGEYAQGDVLIGLEVPLVRKYAKKYQALKEREIKKLLDHKVHEIRLAGLLILVAKYQQANNREEKKKIVGFYLQNSTRVNNWDLVDLSAYKILGDFLLDEAPGEARKLLNKLAQSKNLWERRIAMVSTFAFLKAGRKEETLLIAKKLMNDTEDLIHKASGWMLRELGQKINEESLEAFLKNHAFKMPRVSLRYASEKFAQVKKMYYYNLGKNIKTKKINNKNKK